MVKNRISKLEKKQGKPGRIIIKKLDGSYTMNGQPFDMKDKQDGDILLVMAEDNDLRGVPAK